MDCERFVSIIAVLYLTSHYGLMMIWCSSGIVVGPSGQVELVKGIYTMHLERAADVLQDDAFGGRVGPLVPLCQETLSRSFKNISSTIGRSGSHYLPQVNIY